MVRCDELMKRNEEYARLKESGFYADARRGRDADMRVRILDKKCPFSGKRGAVYSRLQDDMKVEDWLADCKRVFDGTSLRHIFWPSM